VATVTVAAPSTAIAISALVGEVTITAATTLAAGASITGVMTNQFINANSHVICGFKSVTAADHIAADNQITINIIPSGTGTANVVLANGGSAAFDASSTLTYWFRVLQ
jgi:hypothetical protein